MALALTLMFVADAVSLIFAVLRHRNLWLWYVSVPLTAIAVLLGLAGYQRSARDRRMIRILAAVYALGYPTLFLVFEDARTFSMVTQPATALLVMSVAGVTLAMCIHAARDDEAVFRTNWFWLCLGWTLYYGMSAVLMPISRILLGNDPSVVKVLFGARAGYDMGIYGLLAWGFLCTRRPNNSSGSSSSRAERSPS